MLKKFNSSIFPIIGILFLACLYLMTFPTTVQSGDTGELVTNSYFLRVLHPPGYPVFNLIYHQFLNLFSFSTVFGRASVLTIIFSLISILILLYRFKSIESLLILLSMGTSLIFWRYSILPDVFSLHIFFMTLILLAFDKPRLLEKPWFIILIGASVAHHHTIVFLFPVFLFSALQSLNRKKVFFWSIASGCIGFGFYFLLPHFEVNNVLSWNLDSVLSHFLRKDYGTFQLSIREERDFSWFLFFLGQGFKNFWAVIISAGYLFHKQRLERKHWILVGSLIVYLLVFALGGSLSLNIAGQEVFERFLLQPFFIMIFLTLLSLRDIQFPRWLLGLLGLNILLNLGFHWKENNYRLKTQVEDFTMNILRSLPRDSVYAPVGDAQGFSAYYVRDVMGFRKDVILLPAVGIVSWGEKKLAHHHPGVYRDTGPTLLEKIDTDRFDVFSNSLYRLIPVGMKVGRFGPLYRYSRRSIPENDCDVSASYIWRNRPALDDLSNFDNGYFLYMSIEECFLHQGIDAMKKGDVISARDSFQRGLSLRPLSVRLFERMCATSPLETKNSCENGLVNLIEAQNQQYYLHKF